MIDAGQFGGGDCGTPDIRRQSAIDEKKKRKDSRWMLDKMNASSLQMNQRPNIGFRHRRWFGWSPYRPRENGRVNHEAKERGREARRKWTGGHASHQVNESR